MVRLVEVVLEPGKRTCPPLATPAGASRLRCVPPPRLHRGGGAGGITPLQGTPAKKILVVPTVCMPGCQNSPHNYECKNTLYDNVLDSSFLGPKLEEADRMSSICGIPSSRCKSYLLDIDLDYFHTRKSVDPGDLKVFSWLVKGSSAITIALEPECVEELQVDGADLSAEYLLSRIESHIKRIEQLDEIK